jgi:hypothetical protein
MTKVVEAEGGVPVGIESKNKLILFNLENRIYDNMKNFDIHNRAIELSTIDSLEKLVSFNNIKVDLVL